jgi:hypothetical protein
MKRFAILTLALVGGLVVGGKAQAWPCTYGGYQPWWNIFAHRNKCLTPEEERLQRFWHDYYDALGCYYRALDHVDWVAYYKNHGYMINTGCGGGGCGNGCCGPCGGPQRTMFAPVFVRPAMDWAVPGSCLSGPPCGYNGMSCAGGPGGMMPPPGAYQQAGYMPPGYPGYGMHP